MKRSHGRSRSRWKDTWKCNSEWVCFKYVIHIDGDEDNDDHDDDIMGFTEGDNFSGFQITKNYTRKTPCLNILRGKKKKGEKTKE